MAPLQPWPSPSETVAGLGKALRAGERTCVSIVEQCLSQIDRWEPQIHAWVRVDREGALERARELDQDAQAGRWRGPLHGIPIGIKDLVDLAGQPTAAGSKLLARTVAERDAPLIERLRDAGAIILGKTVTTQFACFDPPVTRNPWNFARTPGGSSSGSAAAVATGMCLAAIGSQTGGSITRPASYCGVAGCKPTIGRVSTEGVFPAAHTLDHPGPIARCVADLAILVDVLEGTSPDPRERISLVPAARAPRIGRLHGLFDERAEPAMKTAFENALDRLRRAGASIVDAPLPAEFGDVLVSHRRIMVYEIGEVHARRYEQHPDDYLPGMRQLIEESRGVTPAVYVAALEHRGRLRQAIATTFSDVDLLACPATTGPAPDPSTTGDPSFNSPWSFTGLPTVSFPIGLTPDGMPLAIQLVGRSDEEAPLFAAALWCESALRE